MNFAVCNDPKILELVLMTKTAISLLQIIAPLGVVLFASFDIMKAVIAKDPDGINKQIKHIPKRLIAMAVLFFVPTFVDLTMQVVDSTFEYTTCFAQASKENIENLYQSIVREKIAYANKNKVKYYLLENKGSIVDLYTNIDKYLDTLK